MSNDKFLIAEAQLALDAARKQKAERIKTVGDPVELPGKALAIEIRDGILWIAENTTVVRKLDLETGKTLQVFKGHTAPVTALAFCDRVPGSGDHEILISGSWDKSIKLWDTKTKQEISSTPNAHEDFVKSLLVIPSLNLLVSGSSDKIVRFWDLSQPTAQEPLKSIGSISSHTRPVESLDGRATSENKGILFTGDTMGVIKSWELAKDDSSPPRWNARLTETFTSHRTRINELIYGDGQLWTASADESVQVMLDKVKAESATTKAPKPITHPVAVRAILPLVLTALAEPYLLTGAGDVLRIWDTSDLDDPQCIREVDAHWHDITAIRLWIRKFKGGDGRNLVEPWIVTASLDRTIRKWKLAELLQPASPEPIVPVKVAPTPDPSSLSELTEEEERELAELMEDD